MTAPTNHPLTVTLRDGKHMRTRVVYLQPKVERRREERTEEHIVCSLIARGRA